MPDRTLYTFRLEIHLRSPWLVHGNAPAQFGLSATQMRDHRGNLILPGNLLVGRLRDAWHAMATFGLATENPDRWFGQAGPEPDRRARLWIADLPLATPPANAPQARPRVAIGEASGAAEDAQLLLVEQSHPPNQTIDFSGEWRAVVTADEATRLQRALQAGLLWHSQLGAQRTVGFGVVLRAAATCARSDPPVSPRQVPHGHRARLVLHIADPLCVATRSLRGNVFASGDILSGGTLKGALATQLRARFGKPVDTLAPHNALARHFDALRIGHAHPAQDEARPAALPQSLVAHGDELFDVAALATPHLIDGQAPAFHHDWKRPTADAARARQGWGATASHLRVRTAVYGPHQALDDTPFDPTLAGQAWDDHLFAYDCRVARDDTRWLADIHLPDDLPDTEAAAVWQALADLIAPGLGPLGKTDAFAQARLTTEQPHRWPQRNPAAVASGEQLTLQLNTPALLFASSQVADQAAPDLLALYRDAFHQLSGGALRLSHFFASQRMAGGTYLHRRHLAQRQHAYRPLVLTEPGSVFVLTVVDAAVARPLLARWQRHGLPLPTAVVAEHGGRWQDHPYLPQNGYGEIAIDLQHGFPPPPAHRLTAC